MNTPALYLKASAFFTGGIVMLDFRDPFGMSPTGTVSIIRNCVSGVNIGTSDTVALNADINPLWIDVGDGLRGAQTISGPLPLGEYTYDVTAVIDGQTVTLPTTAALLLSQAITLIPDSMQAVFVRVLQGAVQSLTMPAGMHTPLVFNSMPVSSLPPFPFIAVNEEMIQQTHVPIGQQVPQVSISNEFTVSAYAKRMWRLSVFSDSVDERDFVRDYLCGALHVIAHDLFEPLGRNISHRFQAVSYSTAKDGEVPGFFGADILWESEGTYNTSLKSTFGLIEHIVVVANPG